MKLYAQTDFDENRRERRRQTTRALLLALPFFAIAVTSFILRIELLCIAGLVAVGAMLIFLYDLRIKPARRYGRYLAEAHSGLSRQTVGTLVRVGSDAVYQDDVNFHEVILNIYEDMAVEGERRFLLDVKKEIPLDWIGQDVVATSHGSYLLEIAPVEKTA